MKRYSRILWLVLAICIFPNMLYAIDYTEHDQKVREEIWGWNLPRLNSYTVPEKYKNESAVIKPDGTVQEVDVANEAVSVTEDRNNKRKPPVNSIFFHYN